MDVADLRNLPIFDGLTDEQIGELVEGGAEVAIEPGVELFRQGEHADCWWVLVDGAIDLYRQVGRENSLVGKMDVPGRWAGGFRAWDEHGVYLATARGVSEGRVLRVPVEVLKDRTRAWFPFGNHLIEGLFHTARSIESTARQRDALVTLGTLAAGLAHEINNPAAAASRSVEALESACHTLLAAVNRLAHDGITAAQISALDELRDEMPAGAAVTDPLELADREQELSTWLTRQGVERAWLLAPPLAAVGVDRDWCERAHAVLGTSLGPWLEWTAGTLSMTSLITEVKESTRRISELVAAVRSYSQMDRASMQRIDVTEGLESTLVMLGHKLRDGVTVVREYDVSVPRIDAYAGELNQVWTNLIDNAVDAMDGAGILRLVTRVEGDDLVVEIGDTGAGMTAEVAGRAFEAFFTTKDVGRGSGLGLDIARRIIVERHGGAITIRSRPGDTVMQVRVPVRQ